ncbi:LptA/OstA family protein [Sphingorhabdus arenilitoris]|uniref:LptA/OstA family protein n=1 Tax=Sphingorhabdus arenilitoris TaxID=1490041 RepID=A0ABV8RIX3_9SPHN
MTMKLHKSPFKSPLAIMAASFIGTAALISVAVPAQVIRGHNSNAPVDFSAGELVLNDKADRVILSGNATVQQAGLTIRAARLTAAYTNGAKIDVNRFDAVGGVRITKDDLVATSNAAIYDVDAALITLIGNVNLSQGSNRLNGGRIVIDLNADRTTISGGNNGGGAGSGSSNNNGRVTGTFTVPQRKN